MQSQSQGFACGEPNCKYVCRTTRALHLHSMHTGHRGLSPEDQSPTPASTTLMTGDLAIRLGVSHGEFSSQASLGHSVYFKIRAFNWLMTRLAARSSTHKVQREKGGRPTAEQLGPRRRRVCPIVDWPLSTVKFYNSLITICATFCSVIGTVTLLLVLLDTR